MTPSEIQQLAQKTLKEARSTVSVFTKIKTRLPEWVAIVADSLAILSVIYYSFFPELTSNKLAYFQLIIIYGLFIMMLIALTWQTFTFSRKSRYAEALPYLHAIIHNTRDTVYHMHRNVYNDDIFREKCILNLTFFAQTFSLITGTKCRASLKIIREATEDELNTAPEKYDTLNLKKYKYIADTYARDAESLLSSSNTDGVVKHWLIANTDFKKLLRVQHPQAAKFFIDNNLPGNRNYETTSYDLYGEPKNWKLNKWSTWTLPYRSAIIWPIRKITESDEKREGQLFQKQDLLGFLCIDSYARRIFNKRYDVDFGAIAADSFYLLLGTYRAKTENRLPIK